MTLGRSRANLASLPARLRLSRRGEIMGAVIIAALLYWLTAARPLTALPGQWADDGLYLLQGERIVQWICNPSGPWLGQYDPNLLAKPPGFGLWLALVHFSGVPLRVAEFALLLLLPVLFRRAVRPLGELAGWRFLLVTVFLVGLPSRAGELRLLREGWQSFLAGAVLITVIGIALRSPGAARGHIRWAALLGCFFALAFLNREESKWLLPAIATVLAVREAASWRAGHRRGVLVPTLICAATAGVLVGAVCLMNWHHYGLFATSTRRAPNIVRLYETLTRLDPEDHLPYVPIRTETRLRAYRLSPSWARLQGYLEGPPGDEFARNVSHNQLNGYPAGTREFYGSNLQWALLRAAAYAGARDAVAAERLFGGAAQELKAAIRSRRIRAGRGGIEFLDAPVPGDGGRILQSVWRSAILLFTVEGMNPPEASTSAGAPADLQGMSDLTHNALAPTVDTPAPRSPVEPFRRQGLEILLRGLRIAYPASLLALIACVGWAALPRHRSAPVLQMAGGALLLIGSLGVFCLMIAIFNVLAVPHLQYPEAYNRLGYTPLSILAAYSVVATSFAVKKGR